MIELFIAFWLLFGCGVAIGDFLAGCEHRENEKISFLTPISFILGLGAELLITLLWPIRIGMMIVKEK